MSLGWSWLASYDYVVIIIVPFVFYTCILCLDHVIVSACCMLYINTFGSDGVLKCIFAFFFLCLSDLCCPSGRFLYLFLLSGLAVPFYFGSIMGWTYYVGT